MFSVSIESKKQERTFGQERCSGNNSNEPSVSTNFSTPSNPSKLVSMTRYGSSLKAGFP